MIEAFVKAFFERKEILKQVLEVQPPETYKDLVTLVVTEVLNPDEDGDLPSRDRIHEIDDGDYQGTLVYILGAVGYQPSQYWSVKIDYGSCSGCDTLEWIKMDGNNSEDYLTLALHIIQQLKEI